jgi:hypothetical protein
MKTLVVIILSLLVFGCAANNEITKPDTQTKQSVVVPTKVQPATPVVLPVLLPKPVILTLNVNHFATFKSEPMGAEVIVIDTKSGKEVQSFGKTPVRILLASKKVQYDSTNKKVLGVSDVQANTVGLAYGQIGVEGAEFQFKFRMEGYQDYLYVERIILLSLDSEKVIAAIMPPKNGGGK